MLKEGWLMNNEHSSGRGFGVITGRRERFHDWRHLPILLLVAFFVLDPLAITGQIQQDQSRMQLIADKIDPLIQQNGAKPPDSQTAPPTVNAILDKYVAAIGGKEAIESLSTIVRTGTFEAVAAGYKGTVEIYSKVPNKFLQTIVVEGVGPISQVSDGKMGWLEDPAVGVREMKGAELAQVLRLSDPHRQIKYRQTYKTIALMGKEKVGDIDTYVIEGHPVEGKPDKLYFDVSTGLLVREDIVVISSDSETPAQMFFEDYRDVGGIKMPFTLRQITPALTSAIKLSDTRINVPVDDAKFAKPSNF